MCLFLFQPLITAAKHFINYTVCVYLIFLFVHLWLKYELWLNYTGIKEQTKYKINEPSWEIAQHMHIGFELLLIILILKHKSISQKELKEGVKSSKNTHSAGKRKLYLH